PCPAAVAMAMDAVSSAAPALAPMVDALSLPVANTLRACCGARFTTARVLAATVFTCRVTAALRALIDRFGEEDALARPRPPRALPVLELLPLRAEDLPDERLDDIPPRLPLRPDERIDPLFAMVWSPADEVPRMF